MPAGPSGGTAVMGKAVGSETARPETAVPLPAPRAPRHRPNRSWQRRAWWTTPRLVRGLTGLCLAALLVATTVTAAVLGGARDGTDVTGTPHAARWRERRLPRTLWQVAVALFKGLALLAAVSGFTSLVTYLLTD